MTEKREQNNYSNHTKWLAPWSASVWNANQEIQSKAEKSHTWGLLWAPCVSLSFPSSYSACALLCELFLTPECEKLFPASFIAQMIKLGARKD